MAPRKKTLTSHNKYYICIKYYKHMAAEQNGDTSSILMKIPVKIHNKVKKKVVDSPKKITIHDYYLGLIEWAMQNMPKNP